MFYSLVRWGAVLNGLAAAAATVSQTTTFHAITTTATATPTETAPAMAFHAVMTKGLYPSGTFQGQIPGAAVNCPTSFSTTTSSVGAALFPPAVIASGSSICQPFPTYVPSAGTAFTPFPIQPNTGTGNALPTGTGALVRCAGINPAKATPPPIPRGQVPHHQETEIGIENSRQIPGGIVGVASGVSAGCQAIEPGRQDTYDRSNKVGTAAAGVDYRAQDVQGPAGGIYSAPNAAAAGDPGIVSSEEFTPRLEAGMAIFRRQEPTSAASASPVLISSELARPTSSQLARPTSSHPPIAHIQGQAGSFTYPTAPVSSPDGGSTSQPSPSPVPANSGSDATIGGRRSAVATFALVVCGMAAMLV